MSDHIILFLATTWDAAKVIKRNDLGNLSVEVFGLEVKIDLFILKRLGMDKEQLCLCQFGGYL